ncbi:Flp family type IVb pilin [Grimontia sp. NTOU-MAR1]|uniref:Flp family type IVb pilin n=1 Tax=Grimontia sp. NTOU-MAR1 TaxID=3111011 RepID=UPI002DB94345|nr:Flp family type IVb pilin [Grimontia sp. NTOU-MAR1]WRW00961.1 Flp family type IVb pilin [Grimontia sp. NTOU-MAR1]
MFKLALNYIQDESGVTAIEYAMLGIIISTIILATFFETSALPKALGDAMILIESNINAANN